MLVGRVARSVVVVSAFLLVACVEPVKLVVTPVPSSSPPAYEPLCADPGGSISCLGEKKPNHRLQLPGEEILWVRMAPDARTIVASTAPTTAGKAHLQRVSFIAYDTEQRAVRWRIQLAPNARIAADDVHFIGTDKIALLSEAGFFWGNTLIVLNAQTGAEVWRTPGTMEKGGEPVHMLVYDPDQQYFVVGSSTLRVLDANSGQVLATRPSHHRAKNPRVTGGLPLKTDRDLYLYDFGLVRLSRDDKKFLWGRKFATFAEDDYTGANVGLAIAGALLGASPGSIPPDYLVGRTSEPAIAGNKIVVGALGIVHCIDAETGRLLWSQDLEVPQIARVVVRDDRVFALAGGNYIFWHGREGMSVRNPLRYGLYALSLSDGSPVSGFISPFNPNSTARKMGVDEVEKFDEGDAFEEEEDWGDLDKTIAGAASPSTAAAPRSPAAYSKKRLVGMEPVSRGLLVAADDAVVHVDDSGAELRRYALDDLGPAVTIARAGDRIVVRTKSGAVAFDAASGERAWQKKSDSVAALRLLPNSGSFPIVRTLPWKEFEKTEATYFGSQTFWLVPEQRAVVMPISGGRLAAVRLSSGETIWQMNAAGKIALGDGWLANVDGDTAELYRMPQM